MGVDLVLILQGDGAADGKAETRPPLDDRLAEAEIRVFRKGCLAEAALEPAILAARAAQAQLGQAMHALRPRAAGREGKRKHRGGVTPRGHVTALPSAGIAPLVGENRQGFLAGNLQ